MKQYVFRLKTTPKEGVMTWTNIKLIHYASIKQILRDANDDRKDKDFGVYIQPVQHYDVRVLGQILYLHGDSEIAFQQNFLMRKCTKKDTAKDLSVWDQGIHWMGKRKDLTHQAKYKNVVRELHVESLGRNGDKLAKDISLKLKGKEIQKYCLTGGIIMIPQYNQNSDVNDKNDRIKKLS